MQWWFPLGSVFIRVFVRGGVLIELGYGYFCICVYMCVSIPNESFSSGSKRVVESELVIRIAECNRTDFCQLKTATQRNATQLIALRENIFQRSTESSDIAELPYCAVVAGIDRKSTPVLDWPLALANCQASPDSVLD